MATQTPTKKYVVDRGQTLNLNGRQYNQGDVIDLTDADAKVLGKSITEQRPDGEAQPTTPQPGSPASLMSPAPPASAGTGAPVVHPPGTPGNPTNK